MATRSRIGIQAGDVVQHIYCHWDGYPDGVGRCLIEHYNTKAKASELILRGNLKALYPSLRESDYFDEPHSQCLLSNYITAAKFSDFVYLFNEQDEWTVYDNTGWIIESKNSKEVFWTPVKKVITSRNI